MVNIEASRRAVGEIKQESGDISRGLVLLLATACGLIVASNYYIQPLLALIARDFGVGDGQIGLVNTLIQVGQALGFLLLVPLGDIRDRRKLIVATLLAATLALVGMALAPNVIWLGVAGFSLGLTAISSQIIVPFAASLAAPEKRGRVVGTVMSGLLLGILLARTVAGFVGAQFGWRAMFSLGALLVFGLSLVLRAFLPADPPRRGLHYSELLRSLARLVSEQPALREASLFGGLTFAVFSAFWVTLTFLLEAPPYGFGPEIAGLFGLIGAVGAFGASLSGRLADRFSPRLITGVGMLIALVAFVVFWLLGAQLWALVLGVVLFDLGVQGSHIANQTRVYALIPEARSRLNTVYIVSYFVGGSLGSALGSLAWSMFGWPGVCALCVGLLVVALAVWLRGSR